MLPFSLVSTFCVLATSTLLSLASCNATLGDGAGQADASAQAADASSDAAIASDAAVPADAQPCVEGDAQLEDPATGHCYIYVAALTTWDDARIACEGLGGHLAAATSRAENQLFTPLAGLLDVWVGGTDGATEALWVWVSGENMGYTNWRSGEPNNGGAAGEDCMVLEGDNGGLWDDRGCGQTFGYICERP